MSFLYRGLPKKGSGLNVANPSYNELQTSGAKSRSCCWCTIAFGEIQLLFSLLDPASAWLDRPTIHNKSNWAWIYDPPPSNHSRTVGKPSAPLLSVGYTPMFGPNIFTVLVKSFSWIHQGSCWRTGPTSHFLSSARLRRRWFDPGVRNLSPSESQGCEQSQGEAKDLPSNGRQVSLDQ